MLAIAGVFFIHFRRRENGTYRNSHREIDANLAGIAAVIFVHRLCWTLVNLVVVLHCAMLNDAVFCAGTGTKPGQYCGISTAGARDDADR